MNLDRRTLLLGTASILVAAASAAHAEDALSQIEKTGTIRIAVPNDFPPYGFVGTDLQAMGIDIEMAKLIAAKLDAKLEMVPVTSANRIPYLQTAQVELVVSTLGKTEERMKVIDFSHAYAPFYQAVFAPKSMKIESFADLSGKTIAVAKGASEELELIKVGPADMDFKRYEDQAGSSAAFVAGQTQAIATSVSSAALIIQNNPQLEAELKLIIKESPCFMGIAKGQDALRVKVNEIILAAKADGTIDALSQKWLNKTAGELPL